MNIRTSIIAVGVTLALVAPAAANARAVTSKAGATYFFTEHSLRSASHSAKKATKTTHHSSVQTSTPASSGPGPSVGLGMGPDPAYPNPDGGADNLDA
jgi:hypothetical protein